MSEERRKKVDRFCQELEQWARLVAEKDEGFERDWQNVTRYIHKSCLLDRMLYGGEAPSQTPCPVHEGRWSGLHMWGTKLCDDGLWHVEWTGREGTRTGAPEDKMLKEWRDAGCRCARHRCGCTTGWNVDSACGCVQ